MIRSPAAGNGKELSQEQTARYNKSCFFSVLSTLSGDCNCQGFVDHNNALVRSPNSSTAYAFERYICIPIRQPFIDKQLSFDQWPNILHRIHTFPIFQLQFETRTVYFTISVSSESNLAIRKFLANIDWEGVGAGELYDAFLLIQQVYSSVRVIVQRSHNSISKPGLTDH